MKTTTIEKIANVIQSVAPVRLYIYLKELYVLNRYLKKIMRGSAALNVKKYKGYKPSGGMGDKLQVYIDYIKDGTSLEVKNVFELGANFAQDADYLMEQFGLDAKNIYVFEAHPEVCELIKKVHKFNVFNYAVYSENKTIKFNVFPLNHVDTGWSSMHGQGGEEIEVKAIRMDDFMEENNIEKIDFLKIDVEGLTYSVLQGFGLRLKDVNCIQLEAEHGNWAIIPYEEVSKLLLDNGFDLIHFKRVNHKGELGQSDSFWVRKEYVDKKGK